MANFNLDHWLSQRNITKEELGDDRQKFIEMWQDMQRAIDQDIQDVLADVLVERNRARIKILRLNLKKLTPRNECNHEKGDYKQGQLHALDYNVSLHTYPNGQRRVRCNKCGTRWFESKITQRSWDFAMNMVQHSTNSPSESEQPLGKQDNTFGDWI